MKLSQIGERGLLQKIEYWCSAQKSSPYFKPVVPLGDDSFVAKLATNTLAVSTDTLMEGTHFKLQWLNSVLPPTRIWNALGHKAMAANLSDLASMGRVQPLFAFVTLGLNGDISVDSVDNLYKGMRKLGNLHGISIVGGDIIRSDKSIISLTVIGIFLPPSKPLTRSGAKIGDLLLLTGPLGLSELGLSYLRAGKKGFETHLFPTPRLKEGSIIGDNLATSCIDTSDDLLTSLQILSAKSNVGVQVHLNHSHLPLSFQKRSKRLHKNPLQLFLCGGEDYELLFTCPKNKFKELKRKMAHSLLIGEVKEKKYGIQIFWEGEKIQPKGAGYRHF